jgi:hypothetical protein
VKYLCLKIVWSVLLLGLALGGPDASALPESIGHDLHIELHPSRNRLSGVDKIRVLAGGEKILDFTLSAKAVVRKVIVREREAVIQWKEGRLSVPLRRDERMGEVLVSIHYEAPFDDAIPENPVNTDNPGYGVTGHISEQGTFLQAGAGWYPEIEGSRPGFVIRVDAPAGFLAVTAGRPLGHVTKDGKTISTWESIPLLEGLSLSAARYDVRETFHGDVKVMTYLFPESGHLARPYMDAVVRFLEVYQTLFGPYPFEKFAVVENFFQTGYGFPSYTLLGSRVIRLPFIIHTSLPHEIAHNWWGNSVYVDYRQGNWSEGLTTYVSDYLMKERVSDEEGEAYRRQVLRNMTSLVDEQTDFPLSRFMGRYDPVSQAVGYGKGAMVFHMVRERIGEEGFWEALRDLYRQRRFQRVSWSDFQHAFERRCGCSLKTFFEQWVNRPGALRLSLREVRSSRDGDLWKVTGRLVQASPRYEAEVKISLQT